MIRFLLLVILWVVGASQVFASGIRDLEEVTVKVIGLEEIPNSEVQLIELPEPDLGELKDRTESFSTVIKKGPVGAEQMDSVKSPGAGSIPEPVGPTSPADTTTTTIKSQ